MNFVWFGQHQDGISLKLPFLPNMPLESPLQTVLALPLKCHSPITSRSQSSTFLRRQVWRPKTSNRESQSFQVNKQWRWSVLSLSFLHGHIEGEYSRRELCLEFILRIQTSIGQRPQKELDLVWNFEFPKHSPLEELSTWGGIRETKKLRNVDLEVEEPKASKPIEYYLSCYQGWTDCTFQGEAPTYQSPCQKGVI